MSSISPSTKRGAFIVIEGLDRSGKSTQADRLHKRLQKSLQEANPPRNVKLIKFPDRTTPIGKMIDSYLRSQSELDDRAIHLLFSANRWELSSSILKDLEEGTWIICDRYAFSGIAFSAAKGLPYEWCRGPDVSLPSPDLVLFFAISPEVAQARGGYGDERYEKKELQAKVRTVFERIGKNMGDRVWKEIDAGKEIDVVTEEVWQVVSGLTLRELDPIGKLWSDR